MTFYEACGRVVNLCPNEYAKAYAEAGVYLPDPHAQRVQALYILNNISHWRGDVAKEVRAFLKEFSKEEV